MTYIFIGGASRSGTSLMRNLLCSDLQSNPITPEIEYLRYLVNAYQGGKHGYHNLKYYFKDFSTFQAFQRRIVEDFLKQAHELYAPAEHFVLKEPNLVTVLYDLWELIPDAYYIVMIRDPRDNLVSLMDTSQKLKAAGINSFLAGANFYQIVEHYLSFYQHFLTIQDPRCLKQILVVRYEDLVGQPQQTIDILRAFTQVPFKAIDYEHPSKRTVIKDEDVNLHQRTWWTELREQPVTAKHVSRYKKSLRPDQIKFIDQKCEGIYRMFGYQMHQE